MPHCSLLLRWAWGTFAPSWFWRGSGSLAGTRQNSWNTFGLHQTSPFPPLAHISPGPVRWSCRISSEPSSLVWGLCSSCLPADLGCRSLGLGPGSSRSCTYLLMHLINIERAKGHGLTLMRKFCSLQRVQKVAYREIEKQAPRLTAFVACDRIPLKTTCDLFQLHNNITK